MTEKFIVMIVDDDDWTGCERPPAVSSNLMGFPVEIFVPAEDFLTSGRLHATACPGFGCPDAGLERPRAAKPTRFQGHQIPIIFITAFNDEDARARALEAGARAYLVKPFQEPELLDCINIAIQRQEGAPRPPRPPH
jgi:FixJ family two-component response regulator